MATQAPPPEVTAAEERGLAAVLNLVPRLLASKSHVLLLVGMLLWLIPIGLAFPQLAPDRVQLLLGNYTNVMSAIGASIAAGGTLTLHRKQQKHGQALDDLHAKIDALAAPSSAASTDSPRWNEV
jgi:hypothetical protein